MSYRAIGVCLFDNINAPEEGYASIAGDNPFRIQGVNGLSSDVLWVTNLPFKQYQNARFYNMPYIKQNQYFRTSTEILIKELGLKDAGGDVQSRILSNIFSRVNTLGNYYFGFNALEHGKDYRYSNELRQFIYPSELIGYDTPDLFHLAHEASIQSTQSNQSMSGTSAPRGSTTYGYYFPRSEYWKYIFSLPLPIKNDWRELTFKSQEIEIGHYEGRAIKGTDEVLKRLIEASKSRAILLRLTVNYTDPAYRPFQTFSSGMKTTRSWASLPEVLELSRYCRLTIYGGVTCESGHLNTLKPLFDEFQAEYSFSRGLLLENAMTGLSVGYGEMKANFLSAYLRAYDRIICSKAAYEFSQNHYTVGSFGTGRITLYLTRGELENANDLARNLGLMSPIKSFTP